MGETAVMLRGITHPPGAIDFAHLPPWTGTFAVANLVPGFSGHPGKVATFGRLFDRKVDGYGVPHKQNNINFPFCISRLGEILKVMLE